MKASELRIGNFVKDKNAQYKTVNGFTQILATGIYQFNLGDLARCITANSKRAI
jgi:hypothetical protein